MQPTARAPLGGQDSRAFTPHGENKPISPYTLTAPKPRIPFLPRGSYYNYREDRYFFSDYSKPRILKPYKAGLNKIDTASRGYKDSLDNNEAENK